MLKIVSGWKLKSTYSDSSLLFGPKLVIRISYEFKTW